ncbi:tetratricopeptide repeat protein [Acanthopleuribacter pedis]|uniref:Tetratricopeptide repeat protein n=1 Tax=Acanthopleuribacter pedis TaxID=442870 RepID=A0A8J7Q6L2_9BACT|nr:tetratricopeptide repeat protein [Acanthopleuribacter pedis]MBO1319111.1 tetratricopeptide repeat protein [Acanthopleuribacter pedis]
MRSMKNLLLMLILCLPMLGFAQDEYKRARGLIGQGKYQEAIVLLDEAIASYPDWWPPIVLKGQASLKLKQYDAALRSFNDALTLEVDPKQIPVVKYYIMQCYLQKGDYAKVIHAVDDLLPLAPPKRKFDLYLNRGQSEMQIAKASEKGGDSKKAQTYYSKSVVSFSEALKNAVGKKEQEVEAAFQKAYAQYKIGNAKGGIKSLETSIQEFNKVIERNAREERAHKFLIDLSFRIAQSSPKNQQTGRYMETVGYIDRYLSIWADNPDMMNKRGAALQGAKKFTEAVSQFKLVSKLKPKDGSVYFSLGSCQMAAKQFNDAIKTFESAIKHGEADNHNVYSFIAYCYQEQKTRCYSTDIPLYKKAVSTLEGGLAKLSGSGKARIQQELERKKDNLSILEENLATDNGNHLAAVTNVQSLEQSIAGNTATLKKNQELLLAQRTDELEAAVEAGRKAIKEDQGRLKSELETMQRYVRDANKCNDAKLFTHMGKIKELLKKHGSS